MMWIDTEFIDPTATEDGGNVTTYWRGCSPFTVLAFCIWSKESSSHQYCRVSYLVLVWNAFHHLISCNSYYLLWLFHGQTVRFVVWFNRQCAFKVSLTINHFRFWNVVQNIIRFIIKRQHVLLTFWSTCRSNTVLLVGRCLCVDSLE